MNSRGKGPGETFARLFVGILKSATEWIRQRFV
jgi:hypothetical protein